MKQPNTSPVTAGAVLPALHSAIDAGRVERSQLDQRSRVAAFILGCLVGALVTPIFLMTCVVALCVYAVLTELLDDALGRPICSLDEKTLRTMSHLVCTRDVR